MTTTINASTSSGIVATADGSGIIKVQSNGVTTNALAWVNFNGISGSVAIRSAYNVSSITRNGTGDYTLSFTNATTDANYAALVTVGATQLGGTTGDIGAGGIKNTTTPMTTASVRIQTDNAIWSSAAANDMQIVCCAIFGN